MTKETEHCNHPKEQQTLILIGGFADIEVLNVKCQKCQQIIDQIIK